MVKAKSFIAVALAILAIALFENRSVFGVLLTCTLLAILTVINVVLVALLAKANRGLNKSQTARLLALFTCFFIEIHFLAFGAYLSKGTYNFGETPFVLNGRVTTWGYAYSCGTAFLMALAVTYLMSERKVA